MQRIITLIGVGGTFFLWLSCGVAMAQTSCSGMSAQACYERGVDYTRNDRGVNQDLYTAHQLFTDACDNGSLDGCKAMYRDAKAIAEKTTDKTYIDHYAQVMIWTSDKACRLGDKDSCYSAGFLYVNKSYNLPQNLKNARGYFAKACDLNDAESCYLVGDMRAQGVGNDQDLWSAFDAFDKGCRLGENRACGFADKYSYYDRKSGLGTQGKSMDQMTVERAMQQMKPGGSMDGCELVRLPGYKDYYDCTDRRVRERIARGQN